MLASLDYAKPLQVEGELAVLLDLLREWRVRSYLEVGSRYGGSFEQVMMALPAGSRGLAVDFPGGHFGDIGSVPILLEALRRLRAAGRDVGAVFGPSTAAEVVERARAQAPYDAVFIDADHSYAAVKRDFELYAPMARTVVVLHDIAAPVGHTSRLGLPVEVPRFWREIKDGYVHIEIIEPNSAMGIGILLCGRSNE